MAEETEQEAMLRAQREWREANGKPAKSGFQKWKWPIIIVLGLLFFGRYCTPQNPDPSAATGADGAIDPAATAIRTTATELFNAYDANEAAAQARFGNGPLIVTGTVSGIDLDLFDKPVVKLATPNQFMSAQASLTEASQPNASLLQKGQPVELLCQSVGEVAGTPMLRDCDFR